MAILKLKRNVFFYRNNTPVFKKDVDIEKALVPNKISFGDKNYNYFIGYLYNDNKAKPLHMMLRKTSAYIKSHDRQTEWMYVLIEDDDVSKNLILFAIKSMLV